MKTFFSLLMLFSAFAGPAATEDPAFFLLSLDNL
ncbi:MAG: hypothetical protein QOF48_1882, partial [Verrucomicrobiota bacterium]